jgi:dimethylamine monooxygenase subunit A
LPRTNGILFTIHTHLLSLEKLASNPEWLKQFYEVLSELPPHITEYKGILLYKEAVLDYLKKRLGSGKIL